MLFREQNLRYAEVTLFSRMLEQMMSFILEGTTKVEFVEQRKNTLRGNIDDWLRLYEAELFQDRYAPAFLQMERETQRRKLNETLDKQRRDQAALEKVSRF